MAHARLAFVHLELAREVPVQQLECATQVLGVAALGP